MRISNHAIILLMLAALVLAGCQTVPRIPEVVATIPMWQNGTLGDVVATNLRTGYTYVAGDEDVTVVKGIEVVAKISTGGKRPSSIAVDDKEGWVYVVNQYSDNITVIRGTEVMGIVPIVGKMPASVAVEPHSQYAYVVSGERQAAKGEDPVEGNFLVFSGTKVINNLNLGRILLTQVVADPVGGYVYAGSIDGVVVVIKDLHEVARNVLGQNSYNAPVALTAMDVNPRTGEVYVLTNFGVTRFKDGRLVDSFKWEHAIHWSKLRVHPVTGDVYVTFGAQTQNGGRVLVLRDMQEIGNVTVGGGAAAMTIDPLTGNVYVASFEEGTVTVINGTKALATIEVGGRPYGIGVNASNGWVYVCKGSMTVLGYPTKQDTKITATPASSSQPSRPYP